MILEPVFVEKTQINAIVELLDVAFQKTPAHYFHRKLVESDTRTLAVFDDGKPVATLTLYDREVWYHGKKFRMCGIGDVGTHPDYRGRGLASKLMRTAVSDMRHNGYDLSILFTDINSYYEKFGYQTVKRLFSKPIITSRILPSDTQIIHASQLEQIKPYTEDMIGLYDAIASSHDYPVARRAPYFQRIAGWFFDDGGKAILLLSDSGKLLSYGFYRVESGEKLMFFDAGGDMGLLASAFPSEIELVFPFPHDVFSDDVETIEDLGMMVLWLTEGVRKEDETPFFALIDSF